LRIGLSKNIDPKVESNQNCEPPQSENTNKQNHETFPQNKNSLRGNINPAIKSRDDQEFSNKNKNYYNSENSNRNINYDSNFSKWLTFDLLERYGRIEINDKALNTMDKTEKIVNRDESSKINGRTVNEFFPQNDANKKEASFLKNGSVISNSITKINQNSKRNIIINSERFNQETVERISNNNLKKRVKNS
jgi:hypothetical protein